MFFQKKYFMLFLCGVPVVLHGQAYGTIQYSPEQLQADADYFFKTIFERHPNIYRYCGMEEFEKKKRAIYEQLKSPKTQKQFTYLLNTMNPCMDKHTHAEPFLMLCRNIGIQELEQCGESIFPEVIFCNDEIRLKKSQEKILFVNGLDVIDVIAAIQDISFYADLLDKTYLPQVIEIFFPLLLPFLFDVHPPFTVECLLENKQIKKEIQGIALNDFHFYNKYLNYKKRMLQPPVDYKTYPSSSVAILSLHNFALEQLEEANFDKKMSDLYDYIQEFNIKNLFIDVRRNSGGNPGAVYWVFDYFQHDTIYTGYARIFRKPASLNIYQPYSKEIIRLPQSKGIHRDVNLFVLQNSQTASAGDLFCRLISQNNLGVLVGQNTGTFTKDFVMSHTKFLPNSNIIFNFATEFWDFSHDFNGETLNPDIYWDVSYNELTEKELLNIVNHCKK
jgi:hypothetical protein